MPARVKAEGGPYYISVKLGIEPVCDGCKAHYTRREGGGGTQTQLLTPNCPMWFLMTPELLHYDVLLGTVCECIAFCMHYY